MTNREHALIEIVAMTDDELAVLIGDIDNQREGCRLERQACYGCESRNGGKCPRTSEDDPCVMTLTDWLTWEYDPADGGIFDGVRAAAK